MTKVVIGNGVTHIFEYAFSGCISLSYVLIPHSVEYIAGDNFTSYTVENWYTDDPDDTVTYMDNVTIYCYTNSYAKNYAEENDINYVLIDNYDTATEEINKAAVTTNKYVEITTAYNKQYFAARQDSHTITTTTTTTTTTEAATKQKTKTSSSDDSDNSTSIYVIIILILIIVILAMLITIVVLALRGKNKNTMPAVKNDSDNGNNINNEDSSDNNPPDGEE